MRSIGYVASSGSRILVPSITGLSPSSASSALSAVGLSLGSGTTTTSGASSGNDGLIASQSPASGDYVDYGSSVSYVTYNYVATPPPCVPSYGAEYPVTTGTCNGCTYPVAYYKDDITCGTGSVFVRNGTVDCASSNIYIGEDWQLIGGTSTRCDYAVYKVYITSSCGDPVYYDVFDRYESRNKTINSQCEGS